MTWVSATVILANIICLFCQLDTVRQWYTLQQFISLLPSWMINNPEVIGLPPSSKSSNIAVFGTYLFFLIGSVYIKNEMVKWHEDEKQFNLELQLIEPLFGTKTIIFNLITPN